MEGEEMEVDLENMTEEEYQQYLAMHGNNSYMGFRLAFPR
jgi:hypothetical protein